ncbi:hypothetical protein FX995_13565 [Pseudoalteromonas flavipulchra]|nr:hypothetical protein [Pseudoalteromonas flavipulchra]RZG15209.1 hypothetical protein EXT47_10700 [Pseudoalteromonas sp. CO342X]
MSITRRKFCDLVVLNEKFLTQLASDLLLQIERVLRLIGIYLYSIEKGCEKQPLGKYAQLDLSKRCCPA